MRHFGQIADRSLGLGSHAGKKTPRVVNERSRVANKIARIVDRGHDRSAQILYFFVQRTDRLAQSQIDEEQNDPLQQHSQCSDGDAD